MLSLFAATPSLALRMAPPVMQIGQPMAGMAPVAGAEFDGRVVRTNQDVESAILVQGGSLRTWSYRSPAVEQVQVILSTCLLYTSPSPRDATLSRMPSSA